MSDYVIRTEQVTKSFGDVHALKGVLDVRNGMVFVVVREHPRLARGWR